jgi:hypothetical protein
MNMVTYLIFAIVVMVVCLAGIGGWLLPQLGITGTAATMIGGGLGGAIVAMAYVRYFKRPDGA